MLLELEKRFVEHQLLIASDTDVVHWAVSVLTSDDPVASDPDIVELASLPTTSPRLCESAEALLTAAVQRLRPGFSLAFAEAEAYAREAFVRLCSRLVAGEIRPYEFCRVIGPIEQSFDFPLWLGEFYDYCDSCEPESSRDEFLDLIEYAKQYLREYAA